jgi:enamine deaminase RidA (YjgF/YER057c/UK114 family)
MKRERINPPGVLRHPNFTRIITCQGPMKLIFVAGQTPQKDDFECVAPGDIRAQFLFIMEKLTLQLKAAGATWDDVTHRRLYVTNFDAWSKVREDPTLPKFYNELPCSTGIEVSRLSHPDFMMEVDLIAVVAADG